MIVCVRCGKRAPLPQAVHDQFDGDPGGDPDLPVLYPVAKDWFPADDGSGICCPDCSTDDEINEWIASSNGVPPSEAA